MKLINFGSLNVDKVYSVKEIAMEGETIFASSVQTFTGGKGLNQSVAASRAGMKVLHAGALGKDGQMLRSYLNSCNVDTSRILETDADTGHAIIQVNEKGQNSIIVFGGANQRLTLNYIGNIIAESGKDDIVLLQNETNNVSDIIKIAKDNCLTVAWNPSPFPENIDNYNLDCVDIFFVNEIEGRLLSGTDSIEENAILDSLACKFPNATIVLTLGSKGVMCYRNGKTYSHDIFKVKAVDTTAAGDTFTGFFLASFSKGLPIDECLKISCAASAIAVSRNGAAPSIPAMEEVMCFINGETN